MKKIALLFVVVMMLAAMSVTSFAANTATFAAMTVDAGATTATADYTFTFDDGTSVGMIGIYLTLPEGITLTSVDASEFEALTDTTDYNENNFDIGQFVVYEDDMDTAVSGNVTFKFTFTLDAALEPGTYDIAIDTDNTLIQDPDGNDLFEGVYPATTLTVNGAGPVKEYKDAVDAKTTLETAEAKFENVAIYELSWPASAGEYGISLNGVDKDITPGVTITGSGNVEYVLAFYNIEDANVLTVKPYIYK